MDVKHTQIAEWLSLRPKWMQVAAKHILELSEVNEELISDLVHLCKQEAINCFPEIDYSFPFDAFDSHDSEEIRLCSISEVSGINRLAPKKTLDFGDSNITVIFGQNGSGKTGYVRLLKHICGARDCIRGKLLGDVFSTKDVPRNAKISFLKNNSKTEHHWSGDDVCSELCTVDIFDSFFSKVFIGAENEISYEPLVLSFFSQLIDICEKVGAKLSTEEARLVSMMPKMPNSLLGSNGAKWLEMLDENISVDDIEAYCLFEEKDTNKLQNVQERLSQRSPTDKARQLQNSKSHIDGIVNDIQKYYDKLSNEKCIQIIELTEQVRLKKLANEVAARNVFNGAKLDGIGTDIWKELWEAARKYSEDSAYIGQKFPVIQDNSICVLCHQHLTNEVKTRFSSFESYIKSETQEQLLSAEKKLKQAIDNLPNIPSQIELKTKLDAAGIENEDSSKESTTTLIGSLMKIIDSLQGRKHNLLNIQSASELKPISDVKPIIERLQEIAKEYADKSSKYLDDARSNDQNTLKIELNELKAKQWLAEHKVAVQEEVSRRQSLKKIQEAKKKTHSKALSQKKGEIAETLITEAFVQRFNNELIALGASKLKVKLIQSRVSKGKVLHTLQLINSATQILPHDVLSEGENRIVSIAAFLADVTGKKYPSPFVFDDPISSLDQDYEEAVVKRFCSIASERQVIIFTHRLSLLGLIQDYAKKANIDPDIICIREESWGTGEPGDTPLFAKKPDKALNQLLNHRLPKARELLREHGKDAYDPYVKSLCGDFRILLERMIEFELMSGIVERYRRAINTMGKIGNLAKISEADCKYFDELMTKYSRYEHSQPLEAPVSLPDPDELEKDFNALKQWQTEFNKRSLPIPQEH